MNTPISRNTLENMAVAIESVLVQGNLSALTPEQRVMYVDKVCDSLGLNKYTKPFEYISLQGKLTLYATKSCTEQLRKIHGVSIPTLEEKTVNGVYLVKATAKDKDGRTDTATGGVTIEGLKGDALANAMMKAETKAKRRVTLSLCGLGMLDESEIETIPGAQRIEAKVEKKEEPKAKAKTFEKRRTFYAIQDISDTQAQFFAENHCEYSENLGVWDCPVNFGPKMAKYEVAAEDVLPDERTQSDAAQEAMGDDDIPMEAEVVPAKMTKVQELQAKLAAKGQASTVTKGA